MSTNIDNQIAVVDRLSGELKSLKTYNKARIKELKREELAMHRKLAMEKHRLSCFKNGVKPQGGSFITRSEMDDMEPAEVSRHLETGGIVIDD